MNFEQDDYEECFKTIVVGNSGVGKTKIIKTFDKGIKPSNTTPTVGVDYCSKNIQIQSNRKIKIQIWDTAGQEQFKSIAMAHYKNSVGALVVYDVSNRSSFDSVGEWINIIRDRADDSVIIGLVANKIDLPVGRRIISTEQGQNVANMYKVFYRETTVEDIGTLQSVFERLATEIDRANKMNSLQFSKNSVSLHQPNQNSNDNCPC